MVQPASHRAVGAVVHQVVHGIAPRVPADPDAPYGEPVQRVAQRRFDRQVCAHQVPDVAHVEQLPGRAVGDQVRQDLGVGAGEQHRVRVVCGARGHSGAHQRGQPVAIPVDPARQLGRPDQSQCVDHPAALGVSARWSGMGELHSCGSGFGDRDLRTAVAMLGDPLLQRVQGGVIEVVDVQIDEHLGVVRDIRQCRIQPWQCQEAARSGDRHMPARRAARAEPAGQVLGEDGHPHDAPGREGDRQHESDEHTLEEVEKHDAAQRDAVDDQLPGAPRQIDMGELHQLDTDHDQQSGQCGHRDHLDDVDQQHRKDQQPHPVQRGRGTRLGTRADIGRTAHDDPGDGQTTQ